MGRNSNIGWTEDTHNFWYGCCPIGNGCKNCYARRVIEGQWNRDFLVPFPREGDAFRKPEKWKKPRLIFANSMSDFFHEEGDKWREEAWDVIRNTPQHTWLLLTKRAAKIRPRLPEDWGEGWPHVWLGVSASIQKELDTLTMMLFNVPAQNYFLSAEPLLGYMEIYDQLRRTEGAKGFSWIITGGESDLHNPRRMNLDWARRIQEQCEKAEVPFFFKQIGGDRKIDGVWGGDKLDGKRYQEFPETFFETLELADNQPKLL